MDEELDGMLDIRGSEAEIEVFHVEEQTGRKRAMTGIGANVNVLAAVGDYTEGVKKIREKEVNDSFRDAGAKRPLNRIPSRANMRGKGGRGGLAGLRGRGGSGSRLIGGARGGRGSRRSTAVNQVRE